MNLVLRTINKKSEIWSKCDRNGITTGVNKTNLKVHTFTLYHSDSNVIASTNDGECVAIQKNSYRNDWIASSDLRPPRNDRRINNRNGLIHDSQLTHCPLSPTPSPAWRGEKKVAFSPRRSGYSATNFGKTPRILRSAGFTLAEILITIGVIGVVAAMTITTITTKIQDRIRITQFKKAYSVLNNALRKMDGEDICAYGSVGQGCKSFTSLLPNYTKVTQICNGNAYEKGCIPMYNSYEYNSGCSGFSKNNILNVSSAYVLLDGITIITYAFGQPLFILDINGKNGPNKFGYDAFVIYVKTSEFNQVYLTSESGGCSMIEKGGKSGNQMLQLIK